MDQVVFSMMYYFCFVVPSYRGHSPSTPDLLYPHTHLTPAVNLPINQNGLPVYDVDLGTSPRGHGPADLDLDLERQQALYYSSDLINSNISANGTTSLDETLSNVGSADHLIHGGHGNFLSVNNSRTYLHGKFNITSALSSFCQRTFYT